ncbi:MAG TPA: RsbRD N-terminal domain-containing protein [Acidimicrobiales bacterium]|jgi:hypothetical protein|nr:RsbRD N-terminal domain-containing protein [Acidimicrobiales bacterium]
MTDSQARATYDELVQLLAEAGARWAGPDWGVESPDDVAEALRNLTHILQSALLAHQEFDPDRPVFNRIVSPTRSFTGDNADAVYFEAPVSGDREYIIQGNTAGAVYTSFTMEAGATDGKWATANVGVLRDDDIDIDADGNYEIRVGGSTTSRNHLPIPPEGGRITTRHYFEWPTSAAASQTLHIPLSIRAVDPPAPPHRWNDERVAAALRRVVNHVRDKTIDAPRRGQVMPPWLSTTPNQFPAPQKPGSMAFAAADAAYSMAPYALGPDEALVITGRWPTCRFANVSLWNRFSQMYDYVNRPVSRNRANTTLEPDGTFRMILAHEDPGLPNWLDTEGRPSGTVFWRFFLPEGAIETPRAEVVAFARLPR